MTCIAAVMAWSALCLAGVPSQTAKERPVITEMSHYAMRWTPRQAVQYGTRALFAYPDRRYIGRWATITPLAPKGKPFLAVCCGTMPAYHRATSDYAKAMRVRDCRADLYTKGWREKMPNKPSLAVVKIEWKGRGWKP